MRGQGMGLCLPRRGGCTLSCPKSPLPGDSGMARPSLSRCVLGQGSSHVFRAWSSEPLHKWNWDTGSMTFLGSESHPGQDQEVSYGPLSL